MSAKYSQLHISIFNIFASMGSNLHTKLNTVFSGGISIQSNETYLEILIKCFQILAYNHQTRDKIRTLHFSKRSSVVGGGLVRS